MSLLLDAYRTALAAVKTTGSALVEWVTGNSSLPDVHDKLATLCNERTIAICADTTVLQAIPSTEVKFAFVIGHGFYYWASSNAGSGLSASGGGYWNPDASLTLDALIDTTGKASGKFIKWNGTAYVLDIPTVSSLSWLNITGRPIITGTTNPAIAGTLLSTIIDNSGHIDTATITTTGAAIVGTNLTVFGTMTGGATTTAGITNTGAVATDTLSTTAGATIGSTLGVTGATTHTGAVTNSSTTHLVGAVTADAAITAAGLATLNGGATIAGVNTTISGTAAGNVAALSVSGSYVNFFGAHTGGGGIAGVVFPSWTTTGRPTLLFTGLMGFNTTLGKMECYDGSAWNSLW